MFNIEREGEEHRVLSYKDKNCVGCGICVNVCPTDSLRLGPIVPIARGLIEMDLISCNSNSWKKACESQVPQLQKKPKICLNFPL